MTTRAVDVPAHRVEVVVPPASRPVAEDDLRVFARIDDDAQDVAPVLEAAHALVEAETGVALGVRTLEASLGSLPRRAEEPWWNGTRVGALSELLGGTVPLRLPWPPMVALESLEYLAPDGTWQLMADVRWDARTRLVWPASSWPTTAPEPVVARLRWQAGYDATNVPADLRGLVLEVAAWLYDTRGYLGEGVAAGVPEHLRRRLRGRRVGGA